MSIYGQNTPQIKEVIEARPGGIRFAREIGNLCNKKWPGKGGTMAGLMASLTLQNIVISLLIQMKLDPGSAEGLNVIETFYDAVKRDARDRWNEMDLKIRKQRGEL